jgi:hypothetical protein
MTNHEMLERLRREPDCLQWIDFSDSPAYQELFEDDDAPAQLDVGLMNRS